MALTSDITGNASTGAAGSSSGLTSRNSIADNFDTFLLLLTTQLQNQNPLEPLDTNQFTQQLVQFASVEQQIRTNETLTALLSLSDTGRLTSAVGFLGATVEAVGTTARFDGESATWKINTTRPATNATVEVMDANGSVVHTEQIAMSGKDAVFTWNGLTSSGLTAREGLYTARIVATDSQGNAVPVRTEVRGVVDGIDLSGDEPVLKIGDITFPMSSVLSVSRS